MAEVLLWIFIVGVFVSFVTATLLLFPAVPTAIYAIWNQFISYLNSAMGFVWLILPKNLTLALVGFTFAVSVILQSWRFFHWVYTKIRS